MNEEKIVETELESVLEEYIKLLFFPTLIATLFIIAVQYTEHPSGLTIASHVGLVTYLLILIQRHRTEFFWQTVGILGAVAGAFAAFLSALYILVAHFTVVAFFSLITETAFAAILDGIAAAFLYILIQLKSEQKGGENHGNS